jgi:protein TonB
MGTIAQVVGEDQTLRRRLAWAVLGALLIHIILFILNLSGWGPDFRLAEEELPERLIAVQLQLPKAGGGGGNRPITRPPEPVKVKLPLKSEVVPTRLPVPDLPEVQPEEVKLPSLNTSVTSELNIGPVLAPPGPGGTGGSDGSGNRGGPGPGDGPGIGLAGQGGYGNPIVTFLPKPEWTEEARRNRIQGKVLLRAVFAADGTVKNIQVVRGLGYGLDEKAIEATKRIQFVPARGPDGRPASVRANINVTFTLL